jgi:hypothetical protein
MGTVIVPPVQILIKAMKVMLFRLAYSAFRRFLGKGTPIA